MWDSIEAARAVLHAGQVPSNAGRGFDMARAEHRATLLALDSGELLALLPQTKPGEFSSFRIVFIMNAVAHELAAGGRFLDALRLFDAATTVAAHSDASLYCNALWAVQHQNHGLGVMRERALAYIERALPLGPQNPAIFFNAALVCHELGDDDRAVELVRSAVRFRYARLDAMRHEPAFGALREDPRFAAAFAEVGLARRERQFPKSLVDLAETEGRWDEIDFEMYAAFEAEEETRAWLGHWTGNDAPPASLFYVFGQDGSGGKVAFYRVDTTRPIEQDPIVFLGSEGELAVIARDLADFFVLFAANVGPVDVIELEGRALPPGVRRLPLVDALLVEHFPEAAATRSPEVALADAKSAAPGFLELIREACR